MTVTVRFAPSPTGLIHIGNARTALLNALFARRAGGTLILRFDDTDPERSRREYADAIEDDLGWLGIPPDVTVRQSERGEVFDDAARRLRESGRLYPCYETPEELERRRRLQLARGAPPIYDRAALALTDADRARLEAEGRRPHWRFRLDPGEVAWLDLVRGPSRIDTDSLSDPVLVRHDDSYLYTLPSVADDAALAVTHVIRGEDHVTNTAVQIQIFEALGHAPPVFAHHNLLTDAEGEGLSKRSGSLSVRALRERGLEPMAVAALAVLTGSAEAVRPVADMEALAGLARLEGISRAPARFDEAELDALNARLLHETAFPVVAARLEAHGIGGGEGFWNAVRANLQLFDDVREWWRVVEGPVAPRIDDPAFAGQAVELLPAAPWDPGTWKGWTAALGTASGRRGRALFMPLRLALTGLDHGPELAALLPLIGPERARARLEGQVA